MCDALTTECRRRTNLVVEEKCKADRTKVFSKAMTGWSREAAASAMHLGDDARSAAPRLLKLANLLGVCNLICSANQERNQAWVLSTWKAATLRAVLERESDGRAADWSTDVQIAIREVLICPSALVSAAFAFLSTIRAVFVGSRLLFPSFADICTFI
eukprot:1070547-Rhodomonas_salina.2